LLKLSKTLPFRSKIRKKGRGNMEITISEQKVFIIPEVITPEQARERAWDKKAGVFSSGLSSLLPGQKERTSRLSIPRSATSPSGSLSARPATPTIGCVNFPCR